jgi:ubiquinone/menaquinone biosynthesis C-methylase UbiE
MSRKPRDHGGGASQRYHDRVAGIYDGMYAKNPYWRFYDAVTWEDIKRRLPADNRLPAADLGCGTGKWGIKLLEAGLAVTFVDHSQKMLDQAAARLAQLPSRAGFELVLADITNLSALPDGRFGLLVAQGDPLGCCGDPERAVREMHRILAPGGIAVASVDNRAACLRKAAEEGDLPEADELIRTGRMRWRTDRREEQFAIWTFWPDQIAALFQGAGFAVVGLIGKTVLADARSRPEAFEPEALRQLLKRELKINGRPDCLPAAAHLQIAARKT